ncbi:hypothetical protein GCM10009733_023890 [Nonomuraea maheshkhaliensis]|uniref:Aldo/keto reductase n=1 Tax=Nonomuraea maheshkhaliensis TaxID=419590 RepID=A0ABN2F441_9ACTN
MSMRYRLLGRTGLRVSEVFLGAMTFGEEQLDAYTEADTRGGHAHLAAPHSMPARLTGLCARPPVHAGLADALNAITRPTPDILERTYADILHSTTITHYR